MPARRHGQTPAPVYLDLVKEGVELAVENAYHGQLPEHDCCTENGYIQ